jgi:hypothetical protein
MAGLVLHVAGVSFLKDEPKKSAICNAWAATFVLSAHRERLMSLAPIKRSMLKKPRILSS